MKKDYMLKRLVTIYSRVGVDVSVNCFGVVRMHHPLIKDDCYYPSVTSAYELTFGVCEADPNKIGSIFYLLNLDGSTTPPMPI